MTAVPFVDFAEKVLRVRLTPAQRVLARVAFDGAEPRDLDAEERSVARQLFGEIEAIPPEARAVLVAVCGARGGKTYVLGALYSLWRALVADLAPLAPGELAVALVVAPDVRLARQCLRYVVGAARSCPAIARIIEGESADALTLRRPDGHAVAVEALPATRGGSAVRGRSLVSAVLDESAFFRDEGFVVNDSDIFRAVAPRVLRGGMVVLASTPWAEAGLLYDEFSRNHGHPTAAIAAHAPTLVLRNDEHTRSYVAREHRRDPVNAAREFDAQFLPKGSDAFFDPRAVDSAVDETLVLPTPPQIGMSVGVGADFAFRSDSSALAVVLREAGKYALADLRELQPEADRPLVPSTVVAEFATAANAFQAKHVTADGHYAEAIREHLTAHRLSFVAAPAGAAGKADVYQCARALLHEGRIRLPKHDRLIRQLKDVVARPTAGGGVTIISPRWRTGGHGDLVSAFVLALYDAASRFPLRAPKPTYPHGSPEWLDAEMKRLKAATARGIRDRLAREWRRDPRGFARRRFA